MNQLNVSQVSRAMGVSLSPLATNTVPSPFLGGHKRQVKFLGEIRISQKGKKHDSQANDFSQGLRNPFKARCAVSRVRGEKAFGKANQPKK